MISFTHCNEISGIFTLFQSISIDLNVSISQDLSLIFGISQELICISGKFSFEAKFKILFKSSIYFIFII
jgi:hypothetical protein